MKDVPKPVPPTIGGGLSYPNNLPCTDPPYMPTQPTILDPFPEHPFPCPGPDMPPCESPPII